MGPARIKRTSDEKTFRSLRFVAFTDSRRAFLYCIVTCDEKLILYDNGKRSATWLNKNEAKKHKPKTKNL